MATPLLVLVDPDETVEPTVPEDEDEDVPEDERVVDPDALAVEELVDDTVVESPEFED